MRNQIAARGSSLLKSKKIFVYMIVSVLAMVSIYPIFFCLMSSMKTTIEIFSSPYGLPGKLMFDNYINAWTRGNMGRYVFNSVFLTACTIALTVFVASPASYVLSKFVFKAKGFIYMFFIAGLMIPIQSTIIPLAFAFGKMNINDNYLIMILLFTTFSIPISVFVLTGFMKSVSVEMEEAAIIDGCSPIRVLFHIMVPLSAPAIATVSILNFISTWNNLLFPLLFIRESKLYTISIGLLMFFAEKTDDYGGVMAGAIITMLPSIIVYVLLQEKVEKGLTAGAVKG
jgi:ABC-type sugar transport system, permease component